MSTERKDYKRAPLTEKQQKFLDGLFSGLSPNQSAKEAGYSDYTNEVDRLMRTREIMDKLVQRFRENRISWMLLKERMKNVLWKNTTTEHEDSCQTRLPAEKAGDVRCNCWMSRIKPVDMNSAARIIAEIVGKVDPDALSDRAAREDTKEKGDLVDSILGGTKPAKQLDEEAGVTEEAVN